MKARILHLSKVSLHWIKLPEEDGIHSRKWNPSKKKGDIPETDSTFFSGFRLFEQMKTAAPSEGFFTFGKVSGQQE